MSQTNENAFIELGYDVTIKKRTEVELLQQTSIIGQTKPFSCLTTRTLTFTDDEQKELYCGNILFYVNASSANIMMVECTNCNTQYEVVSPAPDEGPPDAF